MRVVMTTVVFETIVLNRLYCWLLLVRSDNYLPIEIHIYSNLSASISYYFPCENLNVPTCCPLWCILCILLVVMDMTVFETTVLRRLSYTYQRWCLMMVTIEEFFFCHSQCGMSIKIQELMAVAKNARNIYCLIIGNWHN